MTTLQEALASLIECARLLGQTQALKGPGSYTEKDARFECAMHEAISKHSTALRTALAQQGKPVAYITETEQGPMVWTPEMYGEACTYCDDGEFPVPLYTVTALRSQVEYLEKIVEDHAKALAQQGEQQPVCHGCGIPAGDVHMSTCKSGKWPSRVSNGDTAAPAPQAQHSQYGSEDLQALILAKLTAPQAQDWKKEPEYVPPLVKWAQEQPAQGEPVAWAIYDKRGGSKSIHWAEQHTDGNVEMYNAVPLYKAAPAPQPAQGLPFVAWSKEAEMRESWVAQPVASDHCEHALDMVAQPRDLTDEEILALEKETPAMDDAGEEWIYFARAVLKKARE